jgi:hypothetical protein
VVYKALWRNAQCVVKQTVLNESEEINEKFIKEARHMMYENMLMNIAKIFSSDHLGLIQMWSRFLEYPLILTNIFALLPVSPAILIFIE